MRNLTKMTLHESKFKCWFSKLKFSKEVTNQNIHCLYSSQKSTSYLILAFCVSHIPYIIYHFAFHIIHCIIHYLCHSLKAGMTSALSPSKPGRRPESFPKANTCLALTQKPSTYLTQTLKLSTCSAPTLKPSTFLEPTQKPSTCLTPTLKPVPAWHHNPKAQYLPGTSSKAQYCIVTFCLIVVDPIPSW